MIHLLPERDRDRDQVAVGCARPGRSRIRPRPNSASSCSLLARPQLAGCAGSLRQEMPEALTLMRVGISGQLAKTLGSTNPCESMIENVRYTQRNVSAGQGRRHAQALDGGRHARRQAAVPQDYQLPRPRPFVVAVERHAL